MFELWGPLDKILDTALLRDIGLQRPWVGNVRFIRLNIFEVSYAYLDLAEIRHQILAQIWLVWNRSEFGHLGTCILARMSTSLSIDLTTGLNLLSMV
jgi:hypothetical protein